MSRPRKYRYPTKAELRALAAADPNITAAEIRVRFALREEATVSRLLSGAGLRLRHGNRKLPSDPELLALMDSHSAHDLALRFGVSLTTVRRHVKRLKETANAPA